MKDNVVPYAAGAGILVQSLHHLGILPDGLLFILGGLIALLVGGTFVHWLFWRAPSFVPWSLFGIIVTVGGFWLACELNGFWTVVTWLGIGIGALLALFLVPMLLDWLLSEERSLPMASLGSMVLFACGTAVVIGLDYWISGGGVPLALLLWSAMAALAGFIIGKKRQTYTVTTFLVGCTPPIVAWIVVNDLRSLGMTSMPTWWMPATLLLLGVTGLSLGLGRNYRRHAF